MNIKKCINLLKEKKITIASVESFTGGLFASTIVSYSGVSAFFKGSIVTYHNETKEKLGIDISNGVINKDVAYYMALKGREYFNVDYCISFTGNAGPTSLENKNKGLIYIGINDDVYEFKLKNKSRNKIRKKAVKLAFLKLINKL